MANTTPLVTTVTKPANNLGEANTAPRVNIQEFCEEYYEDILPIIMEKVRHDRRKDVHTSDTHAPSTTKSHTQKADSRNPPRGRSRARTLSASTDGRHKDRERFRSARESYEDSFSHSYRDGSRHHHMKRRRNQSPPSSASGSDSSDGHHRRSKSKRLRPTDEDDLTRPWKCEEENPFTPRIRNFESSQKTRMPNNVKTVDKTPERARPQDDGRNMIATTTFIRGEVAATSKKKGHGSWKPQDQSKKHSDKRSDFRGSLTSSLGTGRDYVKIRTILSSGGPSHPNLCINKLAPSVGPSTRDYFEKNECNGKYNSSCDNCHQRQSAFNRLSDTHAPSTTKSHTQKADSKNPPRGRSRARTLSASIDDSHKDRERFRSARESYGDSFSHSYRDGSRHHHMKRRRNQPPPSSALGSDSSDGHHRRSKSKRLRPTDEDDLTRPWKCEEENPFTSRIRNFKSSQKTVWFDELPPESIDGYKDLKEGFLAYFMQQKKYVKDLVEIHNIKQKDGETIEDFMERFKIETGRMKGAHECMRISRFMYGVNNPELTKRLNEHVPKTMEEMMIATIAFVRGEVVATSKKKGHGSWKPQDQSKKHSDKRSDFRGHSREGRGSNRFTPLTRTPKEILAAEASKFQPPPPMVTPVEKKSSNKFCDFHNDKGHSTDECMHLKKQIEEKEAATKDKPTTIYMIRSWQRTVKQKVTQSFEQVKEITFPPVTASNETEGPLIIEAEIGGHIIHRMYIDGGSSMEILYEHCFNRLWPEIKSQMVPATTSLTRFSGETAARTTKTLSDHRRRHPLYQSMDELHGCKAVVTLQWEEKTRLANFTVALHPNFPDQEVVVGGTLSERGRTELCSVLKKNLDIFAWQPSDVTGVPRSVAEHRRNIREGCPPVQQKKRGQAPERAKAIQAEVQKLVEARIMREVYYHDWLSNPVMVKKHDGSWRMCVDFTDLNKACPHDCYPLPEIDWKVESLCGYPFKCFLDAYKGYHQIQLAEADEEKISFHTGEGVYCYTKMPFGLKNAGATYQRLMDKAFEGQVGRNIEVYIDDLVVKSHTEAEMVRDIEETLCTLRKVNMKLNPKKYSFGFAEGVFLGYVITPEGIKPCPDKTAAVSGKISAAVSDIKKCIKKIDFHWTAEAEQAFQQLKQHLSELPLLVAPRPQEELIMYLSATYGAISAVLMTERGTAQTPIYFISRALQGPELNYSPMEKLVLSLVFAAKRLRSYFQAHPITDQPIKQVIPRTSVNGQILADFLIEIPGDASQAEPAAATREEPWMLFTDGSSCVDGSGAWLILTNPEGVEFTYALRFQFTASNNEAKYEALVAGLRIATGFTTFSISQVPRSKNKKADALSKIASISFAHLTKQVLVEVVENKSIKGKEVTAVIEEEGPTWMTQLVDYLKEGILPGDEKEARKIRLKARQYKLIEGVLYRRSFLTPWLRCVGPLQADYVMREIHEGSCSMHAGPRSVVAKAMRLGYYWPTMHKDARDMIRKCSDCQGIDIAGLFPEGPRKVKFLIVSMDYFTKWIEAKAVVTITGGQVKKFVWDNIVCRFGIPGEIISDNGKQFADNPFKDWCDKLNITQRFASVKHPQSNRLVERANRSLREGIKARLGEGNKNWVEELPHVLWAHRTMIKSSHGDTPFSLTYGTEAVIPAEIGMPTYRTAAVDVVNNDGELRLNLNLLEERRERAAICEAKAKSKMMKYYNARVYGMAFKPGDFVYRSNDASHAIVGGKLGPK
nr:reverse transcriptase domain-containing protein [Tanacetum cinerariifolium]